MASIQTTKRIPRKQLEKGDSLKDVQETSVLYKIKDFMYSIFNGYIFNIQMAKSMWK